MKKKLQALLIIAFLSVGNSLLASDLTFQSPHLTSIVKIFQTFSPELVKNGEVEVAYCGSYGAIFYLKKSTAKDFGTSRGIGEKIHFKEGDLDFNALELSEENDRLLNNKLAMIIYSNSPAIFYGNVIALEKRKDVYFTWPTRDMVILDSKTNEYLELGGTTWQDDCD